MLAAFIVQMVFLTLPSSAASYGVKPNITKTEPEINGDKETLWDSQNSTLFTNVAGNLLKVYSCIYVQELIPFIYFGLEYKTSSHNHNESFAIACSNAAPGNSSVNDSIWSYNVVKTLRIDGNKWDQQILRSERRARNWSDGGTVFFATRNESSNDNASFYEVKLRCQLSHPSGQDLNWTWDHKYIFKIFYGTDYGGVSDFGQPHFDGWTSSTPMITLIIPSDPNAAITDVTKADFNTLVAQIVFFSLTGVVLGMVGVYIYQTKKRIKRV